LIDAIIRPQCRDILQSLIFVESIVVMEGFSWLRFEWSRIPFFKNCQSGLCRTTKHNKIKIISSIFALSNSINQLQLKNMKRCKIYSQLLFSFIALLIIYSPSANYWQKTPSCTLDDSLVKKEIWSIVGLQKV